jgi:DTW domain-containing protein YfiP
MACKVARVKRVSCPACQRPHSTCLCRWITPLVPAMEVVILQHPLEVQQAKGSARLLHLSLAGSRLVTGEIFDETALQALLFGEAGAASKYPVLLYPDTAQEKSLGLATPPELDSTRLSHAASLRLIVLDGTWRKSRKMLYLNPLLQQLPRLALRDTAPSRYLIRKAQAPDQLSTLEATCFGLMQVDNAPEKYLPLLSAFEGFVAQQIATEAARKSMKFN